MELSARETQIRFDNIVSGVMLEERRDARFLSRVENQGLPFSRRLGSGVLGLIFSREFSPRTKRLAGMATILFAATTVAEVAYAATLMQQGY